MSPPSPLMSSSAALGPIGSVLESSPTPRSAFQRPGVTPRKALSSTLLRDNDDTASEQDAGRAVTGRNASSYSALGVYTAAAANGLGGPHYGHHGHYYDSVRAAAGGDFSDTHSVSMSEGSSVVTAEPQFDAPSTVTFPEWEPDSHVRFCTGCTASFSVFKRKQYVGNNSACTAML